MEGKCKKYVFLERSNREHQMFFGVLSIMPCATAVNNFLGVPCAVRPNVQSCGHEFFLCLYFLVLIFNVMTIWCPSNSMLRPLSSLTMFYGRSFSLICRCKLKFSQNYINIDTDEIQH